MGNIFMVSNKRSFRTIDKNVKKVYNSKCAS